MKKVIALCFVTVLFFSSVYSQKRELQISDFAGWKIIEKTIIDNQGNYISYELNPNKGDGNLIVYSIASKTNDTIPRAYNAQFDAFSEFVVFKVKPAEDTIRKLKLAKKKKEDLPKDSLGFMNLKTGQTEKFPNVSSYLLPKEQCAWVAFLSEQQKPKPDTAEVKSKKEEKGKSKKNGKNNKELEDLIVTKPFTESLFTFNRVEQFAIAEKGHTVAFSTKLSDSTSNYGLVIFDTQNQKIDTILREAESIKRITLDETGRQLAFLASNDTIDEKVYSLYYSSLAKNNLQKVVDTLSTSIPNGWMPSDNGNVFFSDDGSKLFFGTAKIPHKVENDSILEEEVPKLDVWSWTDDVIQPRQLNDLDKEKKRIYLAMYRINEKKVFQLADTVVQDVDLVNRNNADFALGINPQPYIRQQVWSADSRNDYFLLNLKTGAKKKILEAKSHVFLSPTAKFTIWYDVSDSNYYSMNNSNQQVVALTKSIPVPFYDEENDTPSNPRPYGIMGWTENDEFVLVYDRFDIWRIDPSGKRVPVNETGIGRKTATRYRYRKLDDELVFIPTGKEIILSGSDEKNLQHSYWTMTIGKPNSLKKHISGSYIFGSLKKAKDAETVIWTKQNVKEYPNINISNLNFSNPETISNANPQQDNFIWPTAEVVQWVSFGGDTLRGILYKPDNFDASKKYPMISYFYERYLHSFNYYHVPKPSQSIISISFYVSNGYIVFVPDIVYKEGYPGQSAYDAVVSGVQFLTSTRSFIDGNRLGIQGQSWGGYQVAYLVTQTDMFAAAMAGAPVSNMTSAYGGIRWGSGMSRMFQYEQTQSRIGGTLWEKPMHYIENSPLFYAPKVNTPLLMMHNDNDGAVPWYQGIEFFMALYRLNKPVWMLTYNGVNHNIESKYWANRIDLSTRMFQFFNHYLKGEPAPEWMVKGVPAIEKGEKLGY